MNNTSAVDVRIQAVFAPFSSSAIAIGDREKMNRKLARLKTVFFINFMVIFSRRLKSFDTGFTGAYTNDVFKTGNKYLPITNFACIGRAADCFNDLVHELVIQRHFDFYFG